MKMGFELLLLCGLIFIFIVSFCGLLQKIKQSYERERIIAERLSNRRQPAAETLSDIYINSAFVGDSETNGSGVFPGAPPPYIQICPPPKYDDIVKEQVPVIIIDNPRPIQTISRPEVHSAPPPYSVS